MLKSNVNIAKDIIEEQGFAAFETEMVGTGRASVILKGRNAIFDYARLNDIKVIYYHYNFIQKDDVALPAVNSLKGGTYYYYKEDDFSETERFDLKGYIYAKGDSEEFTKMSVRIRAYADKKLSEYNNFLDEYKWPLVRELTFYVIDKGTFVSEDLQFIDDITKEIQNKKRECIEDIKRYVLEADASYSRRMAACAGRKKESLPESSIGNTGSSVQKELKKTPVAGENKKDISVEVTKNDGYIRFTPKM